MNAFWHLVQHVHCLMHPAALMSRLRNSKVRSLELKSRPKIDVKSGKKRQKKTLFLN